jgi:dTDP-4-dehydrorhamnose 3,5-epimerase-like enzyme
MTLNECLLINLPKISDTRGNLTFLEGSRHIPFEIRRVFYLYDVPDGAERGAHALKKCHQLLLAISGSFDVHLDDGSTKSSVHLNLPHQGLLVPPLIWREMENFSPGTVCLVLASELYSEADYYRNYNDFLAAVGS